MKSASLICLPILLLWACTGKTHEKSSFDSLKKIAELESKQPFLMPDTQAMRNYTRVELTTSEGKMLLALFDATPKHKANFIKLVKSGFYNGVLFHRVIKSFMIQTGDPVSRTAGPEKTLGEGGPGYDIDAELNDTLYHYRGALAAAREGDQRNPKRMSSGSQFYIVTGNKVRSPDWDKIVGNAALQQFLGNPDNMSYGMRMETYKKRGDRAAMNVLMAEIEGRIAPIKDSLLSSIPAKTRQIYATWGGAPFLDRNYTVFGFLLSGYDVLDKIDMAETGGDKNGDRPLNDVRVISARVME